VLPELDDLFLLLVNQMFEETFICSSHHPASRKPRQEDHREDAIVPVQTRDLRLYALLMGGHSCCVSRTTSSSDAFSDFKAVVHKSFESHARCQELVPVVLYPSHNPPLKPVSVSAGSLGAESALTA
jgi:hypothetical protein